MGARRISKPIETTQAERSVLQNPELKGLVQDIVKAAGDIQMHSLAGTAVPDALNERLNGYIGTFAKRVIELGIRPTALIINHEEILSRDKKEPHGAINIDKIKGIVLGQAVADFEVEAPSAGSKSGAKPSAPKPR